eukprot:EG_transcript_24031
MPPAPRPVFSGIAALLRHAAVRAQSTLVPRPTPARPGSVTDHAAPQSSGSSRPHSTAALQAASPLGVVLPPSLIAPAPDGSLAGLLAFLKAHLVGTRVEDHDVEFIKEALARWQPRRAEYERFIKWDPEDPNRYMRSAVYSSAELDVLLMCWPAGGCSAIHSHGGSSCWVRAVEGRVEELRYDVSALEEGQDEPQPLPPPTVTVLHPNGGPLTHAVAYINDSQGVHTVQNRTSTPALSLHIYAPGLRAYRTLDDAGHVVWRRSRID